MQKMSGLSALNTILIGLNKLRAQSPISPEEQQLLAQLVDIQLPERIGWWPPSLALIVVICMCFLILAGLSLTLRNYWLKNLYRRHATRALENIQTDGKCRSPSELISEFNVILKRCCITGIPESKRHISTLWGDDFYQFLISSIKQTQLDSESLDAMKLRLFDIQYANSEMSSHHLNTAQPVLETYSNFALMWVKTHKRRLIRHLLETPATPQITKQKDATATEGAGGAY